MLYGYRDLILSFCLLISSLAAAQTITSLNPTSAEPGASITITGTNFGTGQPGITFNGLAASSLSNWTNTSVNVIVPNGATSGNVVLTPYGGSPSNGVAFTVLAPTITGLSPSSGET